MSDASHGRTRADSAAATRQRIVDAAVDLQASAGDLGTTVTGIARRAGVSRLTVYRHFPDEGALLAAVIEHYLRRHPAPEPGTLPAHGDPYLRLEQSLRHVYAWFADTEPLMQRAEEDAATNPALEAVLEPLRARWTGLRTAVDAGWPRRSFLRRAAIGHALAFSTWRSLCRTQGVTDDQAVSLMVATVRAADRASA